ncbi:MAG: hypothetical protein ACRD2L_06785, partial [Terriglobia bacterium]
FDSLLNDTFIVGSPAECVEKLAAYAALGFTHIGLRLLWPAMDQTEILRMTELAGSKVIPYLKDLGSAT